MADPAVKLTKAQREAPTSPSDPRLLQRENDRRTHALLTDTSYANRKHFAAEMRTLRRRALLDALKDEGEGRG